jgi:hypothetical protein
VKQSIWGLANILGEGVRYRELLLEKYQLIDLFLSKAAFFGEKLIYFNETPWFLYNILRFKPYLDFNLVNKLGSFMIVYL